MKHPDILDLYSDYLIASFSLATATGMSNLLDGAFSHDQISRFLGQSLFTQQKYWRCVKPLLRKIEQPTGVIKIDDTILEKPFSTENDIVCWHFDHSKKPQGGLVWAAIAEIVITSPTNTFYKLFHPGFEKDDEIQNFWNGSVYSEKEGKWLKSRK